MKLQDLKIDSSTILPETYYKIRKFLFRNAFLTPVDPVFTL